MARFRYQHIKSSVEGKAPTAAQIKVAEIGVNDFAGDEKLFIKNSENEVVDFPRGYSRAEIDEFEETTAAALNDLEDRKLDKTDLPDYDDQFETISASLNDLEDRKLDKTDLPDYDEQFEVISASLNDLEGRKANEADLEEIGETVAYALNDLECRKADKDEFDDQFETIAASLNDLEDRKLDKTDLPDYDSQFETIAASLNDLEDRKLDKTDLPDYDDQFETIAASLNDLEDRKVDKTDIDDTERVIAESLNDLNSRKQDTLSAGTGIDITNNVISVTGGGGGDLSNYYTKSETSGATEIQNALDEKADTSDIPSVTGYADAVKYNSTTHYVEFYHGTTAGTKVFEYDASPFLIDGMVESVAITTVTSGGSEVQVLEITWNSAAGSQVTDIPLSDIFDPTNYYTKSETSGATEISTALAGKVNTSDIDQVIDSGTSASTDAVSTSAVYDFVTSYTPSITVDQVIDSGTSASTNAVSTKAVFDVITDNELVTSTAINILADSKADKEDDLDGIKLKKITQSAYDVLVQAGTVDPNTLYIITD